MNEVERKGRLIQRCSRNSESICNQSALAVRLVLRSGPTYISLPLSVLCSSYFSVVVLTLRYVTAFPLLHDKLRIAYVDVCRLSMRRMSDWKKFKCEREAALQHNTVGSQDITDFIATKLVTSSSTTAFCLTGFFCRADTAVSLFSL